MKMILKVSKALAFGPDQFWVLAYVEWVGLRLQFVANYRKLLLSFAGPNIWNSVSAKTRWSSPPHIRSRTSRKVNHVRPWHPSFSSTGSQGPRRTSWLWLISYRRRTTWWPWTCWVTGRRAWTVVVVVTMLIIPYLLLWNSLNRYLLLVIRTRTFQGL